MALNKFGKLLSLASRLPLHVTPRCLQLPYKRTVVPDSFLRNHNLHQVRHEYTKMASLGVGRKHKVTVVGSGNWYVLSMWKCLAVL